jgi:TPR repeat protein
MNDSVPPNSRRSSTGALDPDAFAVAKDAAAAAGVTPQEWLSRAILDNARKAGIATPPAPAPATGAATADKTVEAIAQHLDQARAAAKAQGLSLGDWLNKAILANAKPASAPGLTAVGHRAGASAPMPVAEMEPTVLTKRAAPTGIDLKDLQRVREALARADLTEPEIDPAKSIVAASAETRRRRSGGALVWSLFGLLVLLAAGIWALPEAARWKPELFGRAPGSVPPITADLPKKERSEAPKTGESESASRPPVPSESSEPPKPRETAEPNAAAPPESAPKPPAEGAKPTDTAEAPKAGEAAKPNDAASPAPPPAPPAGAERAPDKSQASAEPAPKAPAQPEGADAALAKVPAKDMPRPPAQHLDWYKRAAAAGNPEAQYVLAELHLKGDGVAKDFEAAASLFRQSAERGNTARSQYALGLLYSRGIGVAKSDVEAVLWWQKAAAQGHHAAITQVGIALLTGRGIAKDADAARRMLERAAEGDEVNAQYTLGRMYELGDGVRRDPVVAMKWFILAAEQAHTYATQKVEELSTALPRDQQERATEMVSEHYRRFRKRS